MAQEFPSLCVRSEWVTKSHVSCSREEMSLSHPREMEGAGTMSSSLSSRSTGDRWAGLKTSNSPNERAASEPLCPPATLHLWLNLWMSDMLRTDQQELYSLISPKKTTSPLSSRHHIVSSASLLEYQLSRFVLVRRLVPLNFTAIKSVRKNHGGSVFGEKQMPGVETHHLSQSFETQWKGSHLLSLYKKNRREQTK